MEVHLRNVGSIKSCDLNIQEGSINIKYGNNGIGKSTIVKSLVYQATKDKSLYNNIVSLKYTSNEPKIDVNPDFNNPDSLLVYDSLYFDKLFSKNDILNNTYELIFKEEEYEQFVSNIRNSVEELCSLVHRERVEEFLKISAKLEQKDLVGVDSKGKPAASKSILSSFVSKGVTLNKNISEDIECYSSFIRSGYRLKWLKWIKDADLIWLEDNGKDICPFCGFNYDEHSLKNRINFLMKELDDKAIKANDDSQSVILNIESFASPMEKAHVNSILSIEGKITLEDAKIAQTVANAMIKAKEKIAKIHSLNAIEITNMFENANRNSSERSKEFAKVFERLKINSEYIEIIDNNVSPSINLIESINSKIDDIIDSLAQIEISVSKLISNMKDKIYKNSSIINDFLKIAGMPFYVEIKPEDDTHSNSFLHYESDTNIIDDSIKYLSYGEANALALVLFAIEARSKPNSLIILDDPVSSFDNNKRYAIYDYLFASKKLLKGRTVLLMTHELQTVLTFCFSHRIESLSYSLSYLGSVNGVISEKYFKKEDIISTLSQYKTMCKDKNISYIARITAARKYIELTKGIDDTEYNLLSGLIHGYTNPTYDEEGKNPISEEEKQICEKSLISLFGEQLSYDYLLPYFIDKDKLISDYHNIDDRFSKVAITRRLLEIESDFKKNFSNLREERDVAWDFICQSFHVESTHFYSIRDLYSFEVPEYIIKICDSLVKTIEDKS